MQAESVKEEVVMTEDVERMGVMVEAVKEEGVHTEDAKEADVEAEDVMEEGVKAEDAIEKGVKTEDMESEDVKPTMPGEGNAEAIAIENVKVKEVALADLTKDAGVHQEVANKEGPGIKQEMDAKQATLRHLGGLDNESKLAKSTDAGALNGSATTPLKRPKGRAPKGRARDPIGSLTLNR